ncbi:hypothetical protein JTB14_014142 [Gonioctena quinquepunctata]|nr:hypothetical protein JTB14_014142 [Gonioctena quinquepunctata]
MYVWTVALEIGAGMILFIELNQQAAPVAPDHSIEIPTRFQVSTVDERIDFVYEGDFTAVEKGSRAILCPTNAVVNEINTLIIRQIESEAKTYLSGEFGHTPSSIFNTVITISDFG